MYEFEKKWCQFLFQKYNALNPSLVYKTVGNKRIMLSDIFVQPSIVQEAVYGIGRGISKDIWCDSECNNKYTVEGILSSKNCNKFLVIGSLGNGKTSLLNHIVTEIVEYNLYGKETSSLLVKAFKNKYISYMALKEFTKVNDTDQRIFSDFKISDWMVCNLKNVVNVAGQKEIDEHFAEISKHGILLLVDGLDELDIDDRKELLHLLNSFCENPDNVVITTIRKEVLVEDSWINEFSGFQQIALSEFSREQVKDFISKWKKNTNNMDENGLDDINLIVKTIFENPYIKELAANPLFLTLMMLISEKDGTFPRSRTRVYEEATQLIIERWNEESFESPEETIKIREALEQAAFEGMNNLIEQNKPCGDVSAFISDAFTHFFPEMKVARYIKEVSEKTGIIVHSENMKYTFALQSFMEYFAAL